MKFFKVIFFSFLLITPLFSGELNTTFFKNLAIDGYDSVAYFTEGKAVEGNSKYEYKWKGGVWRFSKKENLKMFISDPEKYSPQYGGYCAFAMSDGSKYGIDPNSWKIIEGKLYLNYNKEIHEKWEKNSSEFISKANIHWRKIVEKQ